MAAKGLALVAGSDEPQKPQNPENNLRPNAVERVESPTRKLRADQEQCFNEDFWPAYPRKVAKYHALQMFCRTVTDAETFAGVMNGLLWYKQHEWADRTLDKIPHAGTWLYQRRWMDAQ